MDESNTRDENLEAFFMGSAQTDFCNNDEADSPLIEISKKTPVQHRFSPASRFDDCTVNPMSSFSGDRMNKSPQNQFACSGVSKCYAFKSQLQEFVQKMSLSRPVYETFREGPSHEPFFRTTVTLNDKNYDSLPGFTNRKESEQSAAEVALMELSKSGHMDQYISQPLQGTGLCKNILQEYAQKKNYAIPYYECRKEGKNERLRGRYTYSCSVQIGDIRYIGAVAKSKKEAEIKAARTALIALQSEFPEERFANTPLTVVPCKRKPKIVESDHKPKKGSYKKRRHKRRARKGLDCENDSKTKTTSGTNQNATPVAAGSYMDES